MGKKLNLGNLYIAFWMIALALGAIYSSRFTGLLRLIALIISAYYVVYANVKYKLPKFFTYLNLLLVMFTIYGLWYIINGDVYLIGGERYVKKSSYLVSIYSSLLPIYAFYVLTRQGWIKESNLRFWIVVFFLVAYIEFYTQGLWWIAEAEKTGASLDNIRNNAGYLFVALIPCIVFYYDKPFLQFIAIGFVIVMLFTGLKRGAILIGIIAISILVWHIVRGKESKLRSSRGQIAIKILLIASLVIGFYYINNLTNQDAFNNRWEQTLEGDSSGRERITSGIINHIKNNATPIQLIFGSGARASVKYIGTEAHNDWLEIAMAQGFVGVLLFLLYWIAFFKSYKKANKQSPEPERLALGLAFIICFTRTFFSMSYNTIPIYTTCILGYCLARLSIDEMSDMSFV